MARKKLKEPKVPWEVGKPGFKNKMSIANKKRLWAGFNDVYIDKKGRVRDKTDYYKLGRMGR